MSYYLEQLQKRGIKLKHEHQQAWKAIKGTNSIPTLRKPVNKMREKMDELIKKELA